MNTTSARAADPLGKPRPVWHEVVMATVLITGANRGIGLAYATGYRDRGDQVIAVCRDSSAALDALGVRVEAGVDVTRDADLARLSERLRGTALDVALAAIARLADLKRPRSRVLYRRKVHKPTSRCDTETSP